MIDEQTRQQLSEWIYVAADTGAIVYDTRAKEAMRAAGIGEDHLHSCIEDAAYERLGEEYIDWDEVWDLYDGGDQP